MESSINLVKELTEDKSCIIVGRCANYIYKSKLDCTTVYLHADLEFRKNRIKNRYALSDKEANKKIQEADAKRAAFHERCTGTVWGDANEYQLCIDIGKIGIYGAVEMILQYIKSKEGNMHEI